MASPAGNARNPQSQKIGTRANGAQLAAAAKAAGFTAAQIPIMVAIAEAESGGQLTVTHRNSNGSTDYGAWQINSVNAAALRLGDWRDINTNARMAKLIYDQQGYGAWSTFKSGSYKAHLTDVNTGLGSSDTGGQSVAGALGVANPLTAFFGKLFDPGAWTRIGMGALGALVLVIGLIILLAPKVSGELPKLPIPV